MALHEQIKRLREQAHLSQEELALRCGFPGQSRIANYEAPPQRKSHREPSIADLKALAIGLGVSLLELLEEPLPQSRQEIARVKVAPGIQHTLTESDGVERDVMADRIRQAIAESGKRKYVIAAELGVSQQAVTGWEKRGKVTKANLAGLAKATGKPVGYFYGVEGAGDIEDVALALLAMCDLLREMMPPAAEMLARRIEARAGEPLHHARLASQFASHLCGQLSAGR